MSYESSMVYTMGTALSRALQEHAWVDVLVDGAWLGGAVVLYDGYGVVLDGHGEHAIVKVEQVAAVRIMSEAPMRQGIEGPRPGGFDGPMPMPPGPRQPQRA